MGIKGVERRGKGKGEEVRKTRERVYKLGEGRGKVIQWGSEADPYRPRLRTGIPTHPTGVDTRVRRFRHWQPGWGLSPYSLNLSVFLFYYRFSNYYFLLFRMLVISHVSGHEERKNINWWIHVMPSQTIRCSTFRSTYVMTLRNVSQLATGRQYYSAIL